MPPSHHGHLSTIEAITELLFIEDEPQPADLVFVFGNDWLPTMDVAVNLFRENLVPRILISGATYNNVAKDKKECELFRDYALQCGVPASAILLEDRASNTLENLTFSYPIIDAAIGWQSLTRIIFICKAFHARRVLMTAAKQWPRHVAYLCVPTIDERGIGRDNWWLTPVARERVLAEVRRIAEYTLKGDIGDF